MVEIAPVSTRSRGRDARRLCMRLPYLELSRQALGLLVGLLAVK